MPLTAGVHLGHYEILAAIGAGGMGEVYRARDTKLNRDVALKVLPEIFTADPDRLARFTREAHVLASLNHPNIAHIHGFEDAGSASALVMELVDGPTLAELIQTRRGLPLDEALPIARQIAEALETAHELGIVHRDLKAANVKVREDGTVKVYVQGFPLTNQKVQISSGGGTDAAWSKNGGELFYLAADRNLTAVPYRSTAATFEPGVGKVLFPVPGNVVRRSYAVSGDGRRFLIGRPVDESISEPITVVLNWVDELTRRVPSK